MSLLLLPPVIGSPDRRDHAVSLALARRLSLRLGSQAFAPCRHPGLAGAATRRSDLFAYQLLERAAKPDGLMRSCPAQLLSEGFTIWDNKRG